MSKVRDGKDKAYLSFAAMARSDMPRQLEPTCIGCQPPHVTKHYRLNTI